MDTQLFTFTKVWSTDNQEPRTLEFVGQWVAETSDGACSVYRTQGDSIVAVLDSGKYERFDSLVEVKNWLDQYDGSINSPMASALLDAIQALTGERPVRTVRIP
jgi:hypothetical protein